MLPVVLNDFQFPIVTSGSHEKLVTNVAILHNSDGTVFLKELFVTIEKDC